METAVAEAADACGLRCVAGEVIFAFPSPAYADNRRRPGPLARPARPLEGPSPGDHVRHAPRRVHHHARAAGTDLRPGRRAGHAGAQCTWPKRPRKPPTAWTSSASAPWPTSSDLGLPLAPPGHRPRRGPGPGRDRPAGRDRLCMSVHCPESNMKLANGFLAACSACWTTASTWPWAPTDAASNNNLNMFTEMCSAALLQKVHRMDPTVARTPRPCWTWPRSTGPRPWA